MWAPCPVRSQQCSRELGSILCSEHEALGTRNTQDMKKGAPTVHGIAHKRMEMHPESNRAEGSSQAGVGDAGKQPGAGLAFFTMCAELLNEPGNAVSTPTHRYSN